MSRLSWDQIRANAAVFAREWKDARYEKGETQTFYNHFFELFGVKRRKVATFEEPVKKLGGKQGFIDLVWKRPGAFASGLFSIRKFPAARG